jgi:homoserine O-acetyltransferase
VSGVASATRTPVPDPGVSRPELRVHRVDAFRLESGHVLEGIDQAYTLTGRISEARDNLVVVFHSLTGDTRPREWWSGVVGSGRALDTRRVAVLAPNLLGSCYGTSRPQQGVPVTPRDMARLVRHLVGHLGVETVRLATGGSLGGMVALEWAASYPTLTRAVVAFAAPAAHTAHAIGLNHVQRRALELGGPAGLGLARMAAMTSYRTPGELSRRFGRERRADGRFQVQSYLDHQATKLEERFDSIAYRALLDAMDAHDVGRGGGDAARALRDFRGHLVGVGIEGDLLYPPDDVRAWTEASGAHYEEIRSLHGHDAFLLEHGQAGDILRRALDRSDPTRPESRGERT